MDQQITRDQIPVKVRVVQLSYFTRYIDGNLGTTREDDKECLSISFENFEKIFTVDCNCR